jgi:hypothetical protein
LHGSEEGRQESVVRETADEPTAIKTEEVSSVELRQGIVSMIPNAVAAHPVLSTHDFRDRFTESNLVSAIACLAVVLLAPLCVSRSINKPLSLGLPGVLSGDEPHYLVLINSAINDGDFDIANNYQDVHRGGLQAGRNFSGAALDHHVNWYQDGHLVKWWQAYEMDAERWEKDSTGHPVPTLRSDSRFRPVSEKEYSQHPVGLAFLLAPILVAFRGTSLVEPIAIFCSGLATVGGCCAWCWLVKPYTKFPAHLLCAAAVAYLGSPLWHYGQNLYSESFLALFSVAAFAVALRGENYWIAGLLLGAGVLIKTPFGLIALPLIGDALMRRNSRRALQCAVPVVLAGFLVLHWNRQMYGDWLRNPQEWETGSPLEGSFGLAFSWQNGLLLVSPALCLSVLVLPEWFQNHRRDATLMTLAALLYGGLMACWAQWWGGTCYSARLILPIVPFLFAPLALLFDTRIWETHPLVRRVGAAFMIISVVFGAIAAFGCDYVWSKHPLQLFL